MNSSDERNRTVRAMQMLGFSFPPDFKRTAKTLEELPVEYMLRIRAVYKEEFSRYERILDSYSDRITWTVCNICDKEEMAYDDIPKDWGWHDVGPKEHCWYMMCTDCQDRYAEKFNKMPEVVRELPKELVRAFRARTRNALLEMEKVAET